MDTNVIATLIVYSGLVLLCALLMIAAREQAKSYYPQRDFPLYDGGFVDILAHVALWMMVGSVLFAGLVDMLNWALKSNAPSVSDLVHYYLNMYPFVGWIIAGLVYHLLVDRPAQPRL
jgi:hypothetical protein